MITISISRRLAARMILVLSMVLCALHALPAWAQRMQRAFETPQQAMQAFGQAVAGKDSAAFQDILGADYKNVIPPVTNEDYERFLQAWAQYHDITQNDEEHAHIAVGVSDWLLPIPLTRVHAGWIFDMDAARDEIRIYNIGANELDVMQVMRAYVDAQREYAQKDRLGAGVLQYAQKIVSTEGLKDGLYWETGADEPLSPAGILMAEASADGGEGFHGYHYRILTAQGEHAPGKAKSYIVNGHMTAGFALVAWPVDYDQTGVMTFIINHDGIIYQKNLGPATSRLVNAIQTYNPDSLWSKVDLPQ